MRRNSEAPHRQPAAGGPPLPRLMGMTHSELMGMETPSEGKTTKSNKSVTASYDYDMDDDEPDIESQPSVSHQESLMHEVRKRARSFHLQQGSYLMDAPLQKSLLTQSPLTAAKAAIDASSSGIPVSHNGSWRRQGPRRLVSLCAVIASASALVLLAMSGLIVLELRAASMEVSFLDNVSAHSFRQGAPGSAPGFEVAKETANTVFSRMGASDVVVQKHDEFAFVPGHSGEELRECDPGQTDGCVQVHSFSVKPGSASQPSMVFVVSPITVVDSYEVSSGLLRNLRLSVLAVLALLTVGLFGAIYLLVLRPLGRLSTSIGYLGDLNFQWSSGELRDLHSGCQSHIREISMLEKALGRVVHALETFGRFIPLTVVRNIVHGDERSMRLHVYPRDVTIMFTDVKDFTSLCERLPQRDLLFVITRYLSVMTRVVEMYDGIVAEVLGDGLLVFWNTPDEVDDHAAKACRAALAMQHALALLNEQFETMQLPQLAIRTGLHTGPVLSGTIGSEMRMKFGCMGDSVNLASRLENLNKYYGTGVICSRDVCDSLMEDHGLIFRKLDCVQVKGKSEPTHIFELLGMESRAVHSQPSVPSASESGRGASSGPSDGVDLESGEAGGSGGDGDGGTGSAPALAPEPAGDLALPRAHAQKRGSLGDSHGTPRVADPISVGPEDGDTVVQSKVRCAEWYERALTAYQTGQFLLARDLALGLLQVCPEDGAAACLFERANRYISDDGSRVVGLSEAELEAWTGVTMMDK